MLHLFIISKLAFFNSSQPAELAKIHQSRGCKTKPNLWNYLL